jgi:hypothetical protein
MKCAKFFLACGCLLLMAGNLMGQNYYKAVQQAHRDSAQNDAEQQRIANASGGAGAAGAPGAPAPAAPAPTDPALQATLKNVSGLQTDFATLIASNDKPDSGQKVALLNDLSQASQGTKASSDSVKKLAEDLAVALAGQKKLTVPQQTKLAREIHALFNSSHLTPTQQQTLLTDVQKILTDAGAPLDAAVDVVTDLKAVVAETK